MDNKILINPKELVAEVRTVARMYEEGKTVEEIATATGKSVSVIRRWIEQAIIPAMKLRKIAKK